MRWMGNTRAKKRIAFLPKRCNVCMYFFWLEKGITVFMNGFSKWIWTCKVCCVVNRLQSMDLNKIAANDHKPKAVLGG